MLDYPREHQEAYRKQHNLSQRHSQVHAIHMNLSIKEREDQGSHLPLRKKRGAPVAILPGMKGAIDS